MTIKKWPSDYPAFVRVFLNIEFFGDYEQPDDTDEDTDEDNTDNNNKNNNNKDIRRLMRQSGWMNHNLGLKNVKLINHFKKDHRF